MENNIFDFSDEDFGTAFETISSGELRQPTTDREALDILKKQSSNLHLADI